MRTQLCSLCSGSCQLLLLVPLKLRELLQVRCLLEALLAQLLQLLHNRVHDCGLQGWFLRTKGQELRPHIRRQVVVSNLHTAQQTTCCQSAAAAAGVCVCRDACETTCVPPAWKRARACAYKTACAVAQLLAAAIPPNSHCNNLLTSFCRNTTVPIPD